MANAAASAVVSSEAESLILVDAGDRQIGTLSKGECHDGGGVLHRAFSLFIFNDAGELLLQQRSGQKRLWPLFWSNSCCSHPRAGESMELAVDRRLAQELGMRSELNFVYKFQYSAAYQDLGSENELCWVYLGRATGPVQANRNEVEAWRWISVAALNEELESRADQFTPWFKLEWNALCSEHADQLARYSGSPLRA